MHVHEFVKIRLNYPHSRSRSARSRASRAGAAHPAQPLHCSQRAQALVRARAGACARARARTRRRHSSATRVAAAVGACLPREPAARARRTRFAFSTFCAAPIRLHAAAPAVPLARARGSLCATSMPSRAPAGCERRFGAAPGPLHAPRAERRIAERPARATPRDAQRARGVAVHPTTGSRRVSVRAHQKRARAAAAPSKTGRYERSSRRYTRTRHERAR